MTSWGYDRENLRFLDTPDLRDRLQPFESFLHDMLDFASMNNEIIHPAVRRPFWLETTQRRSARRHPDTLDSECPEALSSAALRTLNDEIMMYSFVCAGQYHSLINYRYYS